MSEKVKQILDILKTMTVWEFSETTSAICEEFNVTGEAPTPIVIGPAVEEVVQNEFDVIMTDYKDARKIVIIKEVRALLGTALRETKDLVEGKNVKLAEGCSKDRADALKIKFEGIGCTIEIK